MYDLNKHNVRQINTMTVFIRKLFILLKSLNEKMERNSLTLISTYFKCFSLPTKFIDYILRTYLQSEVYVIILSIIQVYGK